MKAVPQGVHVRQYRFATDAAGDEMGVH